MQVDVGGEILQQLPSRMRDWEFSARASGFLFVFVAGRLF